MLKKVLFAISFACVFNFSISQENEVKKLSNQELKEKYSHFLRNHPFAKTRVLTKKERKAAGIPPNAFYEQEWLYTTDPVLGRPTPEVTLQLQMQLDELEQMGRVPGDGMDNQWVERGPDNVGGRTRVLQFATGSTTKVFAGGVSGGLWVNNDITSSSSTWQQVNGVPGNLAISCMTVDPNNTDIMYIGTGEVHTWGAVNGNGVYKSVDGGQNWRHVFGETTNNVNDNLVYIQAIIAWNNPTTNQTEVYFGADAMAYTEEVTSGSGGAGWSWLGLNSIGLYKSTDGINFTRQTNVALESSAGVYCAPNRFDVSANGDLMMGTKYSFGTGAGGSRLYKCTNGTNWSLVRDFAVSGRVEIVCSKQTNGRMYVLLENGGTGLPVIRRSTDGFVSNNVNVALPVSSGNQPPAANDFCRGQAFYDLMIGMSPTNDNEVYVGGIEIFRTTNAFTSNSSGMWTQLTDWTVNPASSGGTPTLDGVHSDQHCIAFAPGQSSRVVFGNDGGVYYSNNSGTNIYVRNNGYNVTQFYKAGINQTGANQKLIAGAQDNGTNFINNAPAGIGSANEIAGGDGCWSFIDKQDGYMIGSYVYNYYYRFNINGGYLNAIASNQSDGDFVNQCGLDSNADILYANGTNGTTYRVYRYSGGSLTTRTSLTNSLLNDIPTYFEASPYTNNRILIGLANGRLLRLDNANGNAGSRTWSQIGDGSWLGAISDIRYGASENEIYVTFHNYGITNVWYTSNGGSTWENKEGDLPNIPVKCIMANPFATNEVILGTELGVWYTTNFNSASPNWYRSNNGMKDVKVLSFDYRSIDNTILAATYGRGMFTGEFWQCGSTTTTWNGSSWNNGVPNKRVAAIINGDLSSTGDIEACSFTVNGTAQVTINPGHSLKVGEDVTVAAGASLTIENDAALVQFSNTGVNSGNIIVKRNSTPMIRKDYCAWASPVAGQQLLAFSPNTVSTRFYEYLYTGTTTATAYQSLDPSTNDFLAGKGYMIRVDNTWSSSTPAIYNGQFTGVPNNGIIKTPVGIGYNLLGNPYPSPIDANRILIMNPKIDALYYWTHNVPQDGVYVAQTNYASYTILGGTAAIAGGATPNDYIQTGQGFFVEAREAVDFELANEYRVDAVSSTQFFRSSNTNSTTNEKHRIWLGLKGADETQYNQMLVGYMNGASNNLDANIDGKVFNPNKTILYNVIDDEAYVIQGRTLPFTDEDVVKIGFKALERGTYEIALDNVDGLFTGQDIYLRDKFIGIMHNIKGGKYTFISEAGDFKDRFEIVYKKADVNETITTDEVLVFKSNNTLILNSANNKIQSVVIYDIQGKQLYSKEINANDYQIQGLVVSNQALIVKLIFENGEELSKKILF